MDLNLPHLFVCYILSYGLVDIFDDDDNHTICYIGCSFKFIFKVGVEESIVNTPWIIYTNQLFKYNLAFCVVCICFYSADGRVVHSQSTLLQRQLLKN
jgi:hypothetical protein